MTLKNIPWNIKLIFIVAFLSVVPSVLISNRVISFVKEEFKSSINSQLLFVNEDIITSIDNTLHQNIENAEILRQTVESENLSVEQKIYLISTFVKKSEIITSVELVVNNKNGFESIISSYKDETELNYKFLREILEDKKNKDDLIINNILISSPKYFRTKNFWSNWIILPVKLNGKLKAYLAVQNNLNILVRKLENNFLSKIGNVFVLDSNKEIFLTNKFTSNINSKIINDAVYQLNKQNKIGLINNYKFEGSQNYVVSFGYPKEVNWAIIGIIDENAAYATVNEYIIFISIFISITTLITLIVASAFSKFVISKPIEELSTASKEVANGIFHVPVKYNANDSIGLLNSSLNQMATQLQKNFQEIENQKKQLEDYSKNLELKVIDRTRELNEANNELKKAYQRVLELNEEKNEFLGIAAHDLKNPLTAVSAFADILKNDKDLSEEQHDDFLNEIIKASERMFFIVKNLLDVNAIEQGKLNTNIQQVSLLKVVDEISNQFKDSLVKKNISLIKSIEIDNPIVLADYNLTLQVVQNILSNAIKFSQPNKNITITLRKSYTVNMIDLSIKDEGPGFSEEDKKKLFKKFARLSARPTAGEHSTGLGLSIVKKLIEMMDGKINLISESGKGAEFIISFLSQISSENN